MADEGSLLLDAKRLTARARVKRDNALGVRADGQFATALSKLTAQFASLQAQLDSYSQLRQAGIPLSPLPDLQRAVGKLETQIDDVGRPTPQFLSSRSTELAATINALQVLCNGAWRTWASERRASLTVEPELLGGIRGQQFTEKIAVIAREATKPFDQASISLFRVWVAQAEDLIAQLRSPMRPEDVLARIEAGGGRLTFADLTHEEVDVLRDSPEHSRRVRLNVR